MTGLRTVPLYGIPCPDCGQQASHMELHPTHTVIRHRHGSFCRTALCAGQVRATTGGAR